LSWTTCLEVYKGLPLAAELRSVMSPPGNSLVTLSQQFVQYVVYRVLANVRLRVAQPDAAAGGGRECAWGESCFAVP